MNGSISASRMRFVYVFIDSANKFYFSILFCDCELTPNPSTVIKGTEERILQFSRFSLEIVFDSIALEQTMENMRFLILFIIVGLSWFAAAAPHEDMDVCNLKMMQGVCRAGLPRYYYDNTEKVCKSFAFGGCHGNGNNFETQEECEERCAK